MKELVKIEQDFGGDGGKVTGAAGVEGEQLKVAVEITYPAMKIIEPATEAFDKILTKIAETIPGQWDDAIINQFKEDYKTDLIAFMNK